MSYSLQASRKGSSTGGNLTSRSSSGFGDDSYSFRPDTAPGNPREKGLPVSPLAADGRSKSVPVDMKLPGRFSTSPVRPSSREFLKGEDTDSVDYENNRPKTVTCTTASETQPWYMSMLREKEERLLHMGDEINRLSAYEEEAKKKDAVISELQKQIALQEALKGPKEAQSNAAISDLKERVRALSDEVLRLGPFEEECKNKDEVIMILQNELDSLRSYVESGKNTQIGKQRPSLPLSEDISTPPSGMKSPASLVEGSEMRAYSEKVRSLRESLQGMSEDVDALKERFDSVVPEKLTPEDEVILLREDLEIKTHIIIELEEKLLAAHKELSINEGFVTALQKDVQLRENKIMKLTTQIEKVEEKAKQAKNDSRAMSKKFSDMKETRNHSDMVVSAERDLVRAKEDLQHAEELIAKQKEKIDKQSKEIRDSHRKVKKGNEQEKHQKRDIKNLTQDLEETKRQEQLSRVTCEQVSAKYERLRSRIIQAVYVTPGSAHPKNILLSDIIVFNAVKKIIDDRSEFHEKILTREPDFPPLQVELDATPDDEKPEEPAPATTGSDRKSGKGGRKSPKHR